jgi:hypothetical protein
MFSKPRSVNGLPSKRSGGVNQPILGIAAVLDSRSVRVLDQFGCSQKGLAFEIVCPHQSQPIVIGFVRGSMASNAAGKIGLIAS